MKFLAFIPGIILYFLWPLLLSEPVGIFFLQLGTAACYAAGAGIYLELIPDLNWYTFLERVILATGVLVALSLIFIVIAAFSGLVIYLSRIYHHPCSAWLFVLPAGAVLTAVIVFLWPIYAFPVIWPMKTGNGLTEEDWYVQVIQPGLKYSFRTALESIRYFPLNITGPLVVFFTGNCVLFSAVYQGEYLVLSRITVAFIFFPLANLFLVKNTVRSFMHIFPNMSWQTDQSSIPKQIHPFPVSENERFYYAAVNGDIRALNAVFEKSRKMNAGIRAEEYELAADLVSAVYREDYHREEKLIRSVFFSPENFVVIVNDHLLKILFKALENECAKTLAAILDGGGDVNMADGDGNTPLNIAARNNKLKIAGLLLDRGADIEAATERGYTPIQFAGTPEMRAYLKEKGAKDAFSVM